MKKITNIVYSAIFIFILFIAGLTALSAFGLPKQLRFFVVLTSSMQPTIKRGSLIVVKPQSTYRKGDIITFKREVDADIKNPSVLITHRIVDIKKNNNKIFYTTKGDANKTPDMDIRSKDLVLGKEVLAIPYIGYPIGFSKTVSGFTILIVIPATIIVYTELMNIKNEAIRLLAERKKRKLTTKEKIEEKIGEEIIAVEKEIKKDVKQVLGQKK